MELCKDFIENGDILLSMLDKKLNIDISDSCYYSEEEIGVYYKNENMILDISVFADSGEYSYYFKNYITEEELLADNKYVKNLHSDPLIDVINNLNLKGTDNE